MAGSRTGRAVAGVKRASSKHGSTSHAAAIREYLQTQPPESRKVLERMRNAIRAVAPRAVEHFSYGMPGFRLNGKTFVWYAAWKEHYSLYPIGTSIVRSLGSGVAGIDTSSKGTIRFAAAKPPTAAMVKRLVKARLSEMRAAEKA